MDASVCLLLYDPARRVSGNRTCAVLSALLYAVYPLAIYIGLHYYYQIPLDLIDDLAGALHDGAGNVEERDLDRPCRGAFGLAQPVTLPLLAILPVVRAVECIRRALPQGAGCLLWCLAFAAAGLGMLAPWTIRNYELFHRFVPIRNGAAEGTDAARLRTDAYLDLTTTADGRRPCMARCPRQATSTRAAVENHLEHLKTSAAGLSALPRQKSSHGMVQH